MTTIKRPAVYKIVLFQLVITALVSVAALGFIDIIAARSALFGGLACTLPNAYFTWRAFRYRGALNAQQIANSLYQGVAWKFVLTALAFVVIFKLGGELNYLVLFMSFIAVQLGQMTAAKILNL